MKSTYSYGNVKREKPRDLESANGIGSVWELSGEDCAKDWLLWRISNWFVTQELCAKLQKITFPLAKRCFAWFLLAATFSVIYGFASKRQMLRRFPSVHKKSSRVFNRIEFPTFCCFVGWKIYFKTFWELWVYKAAAKSALDSAQTNAPIQMLHKSHFETGK